MSFLDPQNPGIGGTFELTQAESLVVQNIAALGVPGGDRILFYDVSAGGYAYLTAGTGLTITNTTITASSSGVSGTQNEIAYFDTTTSIASLTVATYPSLTELAYVKGVTSAIQTQFTAKAPLVSPSFTTPTLGVATATSINKVAITAPASSATLTIADGKTATHNASTTFAGTDGKTLTISNSGTLAGGDAFVLAIAAGKTLTVSNTITLAGTDSTVMTFPSTSATIARTDAANTFTGTQTIGALVATTVNGNTFTTGTGVLTIAAAKTLTISNSLTLAGTDGKGINVGAATSGKILIGDGSNMVLSTPTYPTTAGTSGNVLTSDGTNWLSSAPASASFPTSIFAAGWSALSFTGTNSFSTTVTLDANRSEPNISITTAKSIGLIYSLTPLGALSRTSALTVGQTFYGAFKIYTLGTDIEIFLGISSGVSKFMTTPLANSLIDFTGKHVGFKITRINSGTCSLFATVGNDTSETASSALATISQGDFIEVAFKVGAGSTSIDFYYRVNNATTWSSATNLATNLPNVWDSVSFFTDTGNGGGRTPSALTYSSSIYMTW